MEQAGEPCVVAARQRGNQNRHAVRRLIGEFGRDQAGARPGGSETFRVAPVLQEGHILRAAALERADIAERSIEVSPARSSAPVISTI